MVYTAKASLLHQYLTPLLLMEQKPDRFCGNPLTWESSRMNADFSKTIPHCTALQIRGVSKAHMQVLQDAPISFSPPPSFYVPSPYTNAACSTKRSLYTFHTSLYLACTRLVSFSVHRNTAEWSDFRIAAGVARTSSEHAWQSRRTQLLGKAIGELHVPSFCFNANIFQLHVTMYSNWGCCHYCSVLKPNLF